MVIYLYNASKDYLNIERDWWKRKVYVYDTFENPFTIGKMFGFTEKVIDIVCNPPTSK